MFVDASAIVAILTGEAEADSLSAMLKDAPAPITSAVAVFEAVLGICRKYRMEVTEAHRLVQEFMAAVPMRTVPVTDRESAAALEAFARYGKGRGHPAQLNMGDCFAYAVARTHQVPLLFKGDDLDRTDIPLPSPR